MGTSTTVLSGVETVVAIVADGERVSTVEVATVTVGGSTGVLTVGETDTSSALSDQCRGCKPAFSCAGPFLG